MRRVLVLVAIVLAMGCREGQTEPETSQLPDQVVEGFTLHESASGERLYTLEAETAYVYESQQRIDVCLPVVYFYDEDGQVHATLEADQGAIYSRTDDLVARGDVFVQTADSTLLWTDSLCWSNRTRQVKTDARVEIETPRGWVAGQGLISDAGLNKIEIQSEVEGTSEYRFDHRTEEEPEEENHR